MFKKENTAEEEMDNNKLQADRKQWLILYPTF